MKYTTVSGSDYASAVGADASVTLAAHPGYRHVITGIVASYDDEPDGGQLTITDDGVTVMAVDITAAGAAPFTWSVPMGMSIGGEVVVTLANGGAGITGNVTVIHYETQ